MTGSTPSLDDRLAHAERELVCAEMIDDFRRMEEETSYWRRQVGALKAKIAERDEQYLPNAVAALGDRHAG